MTSIEHLNFAVTYRCNSRCVHCKIWLRCPKDELTLEEIHHKILQSPILSNIQTVGITGGEPFIREDLHEICKLFYELHPNIYLNIATHGMLGLKIAERALGIRDVSPNGRFGMSISIDGQEEDHDRQRGIKGAFRKTMETIKILRSEGVQLCLSMTITPQNFRSIKAVYGLACELKVGFITRFMQKSAYYGNEKMEFSWNEESLQNSNRILNEVIQRILAMYDLFQKKLDPYIYFLTRVVEYQQLQRRLTPCFSGTHSIFIDNFGKVYPCIMFDYAIGSIRENTLSNIFTSFAFEQVRASIAREECHCWTECETIKTLEELPELLDWDPKEFLPQYGLRIEEIDGVLHAWLPQ